MSPRRRIAPCLVAALTAGLLAACGSGSTNTVSVANTETPPASPSSATSSTSTSASSTSTASTTTGTTPSSSTSATGSTRTESGPAFAQTTTSAGGPAGGPVSVVIAHGFTPVSTAQFNPQDTLQVLVGSRADGGQKAFFFVDGHFIGTDTSVPSSDVSVVSTSDTQVTLGYQLVHPDGTPAGVAQVRYALNNGALGPLDPIPSASPAAAVSRR